MNREMTTPDQLARHGITRRHLMRILGTGAALGMPATASARDSRVQFSLQDATSGDRPELVVGVQGLPGAIDPPQSASNVSDRVLSSIFDSLIATDFAAGDPPGTGSDLVPSLAESWERIDDRTLELTLRQDVLFHDGSPMTAKDVKFTIDRLVEADTEVEFAYAASAIATIEGAEVIDDYTIRVTTIDPDPVLEKRLAAWPIFIVPKAVVEEQGNEAYGAAPVGTGPYQLNEFIADDRLVLDAFDDYWGELPPVSRVTFRVIPEMATRMTSIISDETQIVTNVPPDQVATFDNEESVSIQQIPLANYHVLIYRTHNEVMANKQLRQALNLAIDRQLLIDTLWGGSAVLTRGPQIEALGDLYDEERPFMEFDPERAQELLAESGYNGETVRFRAHPSYYTLGLEAAQAIVQMWQQIGVNAELDAREDIWGDPEEIMAAHWSNSLFPYDPDTSFWAAWGPNGRPQLEWWTPENPEYNELGEQARQTLDPEERFEMYRKLYDIWMDEAPGTVLYVPVENYAVRDSVEWTPYSVYAMDLRSGNLTVTPEE